MSNRTLNSRGRHNGTAFILSCRRTVFSELPLHGRWLPAERLRLYTHMKSLVAVDIAFPLSTMMIVVNKMLPLSNADPKQNESSGGGFTASSLPIYLSDTLMLFLGYSKRWSHVFCSFQGQNIILGTRLCLDKQDLYPAAAPDCGFDQTTISSHMQ
jgi:hypothetical protein